MVCHENKQQFNMQIIDQLNRNKLLYHILCAFGSWKHSDQHKYCYRREIPLSSSEGDGGRIEELHH